MPLHAADFYVANSGSDSNPGTQAQPFATVAKGINSSDSGDSIFLARGSVFREGGLNLSSSKILRAYGNASSADPVVSGSNTASGWSTYGPNPAIYVASFTPGQVRQLFVNGQRMTLARTPNTGWLRTDDGTSDNQITDAALASIPGAAAGRWNGAQVRWRKWTWIYETRPISNDNGSNTLSLGGSTSLGLTGIDSGYFIDNSLAALDAPGEWFYDGSAQLLYLYPPTPGNPNSSLVEAGWRDSAMELNGAIVENVTFQHFHNTLSINQPSTLRNSTVRDASGNGINGTWSAGGTLITGCTLRDILDVGIEWVENPGGPAGTIFERNELTRIGSRPGLMGNGPWRGSGIILAFTPAVTIRLNRLTDIGYAGVLPNAPGSIIERNVFNRCMATLNDGAAIYTNANRTFVRENIILNTIGDLESSQEWFPLGHGIWPEFLSKFRESDISNNTVYGSGGNGIWLPNNYECTIRNNTLVSNRSSALSLGGGEDAHATPADFQQNHTIQNNTLAIGAKPWVPFPGQILRSPWWFSATDYLLMYQIYGDRDLDFGTMTGTQMLNQDGLQRIKQEGTGGVEQTVSQWQSTESAWADTAPNLKVGNGFLFINDTESSVNWALPTGIVWQSLAGATVGSTVAIAPFRSQLLIATSGNTSALDGYYLASELNQLNALQIFRQANGLAANGSQDTATPAGDGVANLLKFAFNMLPSGGSLNTPNNSTLQPAGNAGLPNISLTTGGNLQVQFVRRIPTASPAPGIIYTVQFSNSLEENSWVDHPGTGAVISAIDSTFERVTITDSASPADRRFGRLKITAP